MRFERRSYFAALGPEAMLVLAIGDGGALEVVVVDLAGISGEVDLGLGGKDIGLIDALKRHAVDLVGASDEEEATLELSEEDNTLSLESSGKKDEDLPGDDTSKSGWLGGLGGK